ncbi:MAG: hypothetical protein JST00_38030 [Deltaproteobacteria bacterium]|nr:hypothetical protein [Deltaproteobacteria bacterium]
MRGAPSAVWATMVVAMVACAPGRAPSRPLVVAVAPKPVEKVSSPAPSEPPEHDWHTWDPEPFEGTEFYQVASVNFTAPSIGGGEPCNVDVVEGGAFLRCGAIARIDGPNVDTDFPNPAAVTEAIQGRYPDDLWTYLVHEHQHGWRPPRDPFVEKDASWRHKAGASRAWESVATTSRSRFPYVGGASALPELPLLDWEAANKRPKSCADYACFHLVPRILVVGASAPRPDFSALKDRIAWLHHYDPERWEPEDFAFGVDPSGPVFVAMRAQDLATGKKGFGVARWSPGKAATFQWLPPPLVAATGYPEQVVTAGAHASFLFVVTQKSGARDHYRVELDGSAWRATKLAKAPDPVVAPAPSGRRYVQRSSPVRIEPDGTETELTAFGPDARVTELSAADAWITTPYAAYRTIRPREVLYRTEAYGALHPWAPSATPSCPHMFAVLDATIESFAKSARETDWHFHADLPILEFTVHGHVVVGAVVPSLERGEAILENNRMYHRALSGPPTGVVCARPMPDAKPYVDVPDPRLAPPP